MKSRAIPILLFLTVGLAACLHAAGAQHFARIRAYLSTARKHGLDLLPAITRALSGHPFLPACNPSG